MIEYVNINIQNYYKNWQNSAGPQTIYDPAYLAYFTPPSYEKAASVLHMLRLELTDEVFWTMIQAWFADNLNGNVITEEFQAHCENISGLDLDQFLNQIKFYNNVTSDSGVDFYLTIPFYVGEESDSLRTTFTPGFSMTDPIDVDDINSLITLDPDSWNLVEGSQELAITLSSVYAGDGQAILNWTSFANEADFIGYNIYMKELSAEEWTLVNPEALMGNSYFVENLENGLEYHFYVVIADADGFESYPTDSLDLTITPQAIEPTQSILIVDDSADGVGALLSPTDEDIDNFYIIDIFAGYEVSNLDLNEETITFELMSDYDLVIWHNDTIALSDLDDYEGLLGNYLLSGGKLVLSGWKTVAELSPNFLSTFMGIDSFQVINTPTLNTAISSIPTLPNLEINPSLLPEIWNGNLSMVTTFSAEEENTLYTMDQPSAVVAVRSSSQHNWETYFFGFPLYYFQPEQVRSMILSLLNNTNPPVENENDVSLAQSKLTLYPNPTSNTLYIKSDTKTDESLNIYLYNLRGQKVGSYNNMKIKNGNLQLDLTEIKLANGLYFVKIYNNKRNELRKLLILK